MSPFNAAESFDLAQFQADFVAQVTQSSLGADLAQAITPVCELTEAEALNIYVKDYRARLSDVLMSHYPSCHFILGDNDFLELSQSFMAQYPSRVYDLDCFGAELSQFLQTHPFTRERAFLPELANLEWTLHRLFHAPVCPANDLSFMQQVADPGALIFELIPTLKLWQSPYALFDLWQLPNRPDQRFEIGRAQHLISYKNSSGVRASTVSPIQTQLLQSFQMGQTLAQALETLEADSDTDLNAEISRLFALLKTAELVKSIRAT